MDLIKIEPTKRYDPSKPPIFAFESEFGAIGADMKSSYTDKDKIGIYRPVACVTFPRLHEGCLIVAAEQAAIPRLKKELYILYESTFTDTNQLIKHLLEVRDIMKTDIIYGRLDDPEQQFLHFKNEQLRKDGKREIIIQLPPQTKDGGLIGYHLNVLKDLTEPDTQRVFFRKGSTLPQQLAQAPEQAYTAVDTDHPVLGTLGYLVSALSMFETIEPEKNTKKKVNKYKTLNDVLEWGLNPETDDFYDPFKGL